MFTSFKPQKYIEAVFGVFRRCLLQSNSKNILWPFLAFSDDVYFIQTAKIFWGRFWRFQTMFTSFKLRKYFEAVFGVFRRCLLHSYCKNIPRPFLAFSDDVYFIQTKKIFWGRFWRFQTMFTSFKLRKYFEAVVDVFRRCLLHSNSKNILRPFFAFSDDVYFIRTAKIFWGRFWRFPTMFTSFKLRKYVEAVFGVFRRCLLHSNFKNILRPFLAFSDDVYFIQT